jgi:hypothetical protein
MHAALTKNNTFRNPPLLPSTPAQTAMVINGQGLPQKLYNSGF